MWVLNYVIILVLNMLSMLVVTLMMASLTLIERKVLSLVQSRVGPFFVGYSGRLQYIADALKLFMKGILVPYEVNKFWYVLLPSFTAGVCYILWMNSTWGPSMSLFELEYNIVYASLLSVIFGYCIMLTGFVSKNKYALLSSVRCGILMLNLEIFLGLLILNLMLFSESFCFSVFIIYQEFFWLFIMFFILLGLIIITFLLETNSAPFDLAEAETELIAGYSIEYGGFYFALYYLGEYFHLFFFSMVMTLLLFGGWEYPNFFFFLFIYEYIY